MSDLPAVEASERAKEPAPVISEKGAELVDEFADERAFNYSMHSYADFQTKYEAYESLCQYIASTERDAARWRVFARGAEVNVYPQPGGRVMCTLEGSGGMFDEAPTVTELIDAAIESLAVPSIPEKMKSE